MTSLIIDIVGWIGAVSLLLAYGGVSTQRLDPTGLAYQSLNFVGSAFLIVNGSYYGAFPSVGLNVVWVGIAVVAIAQITRRRWRSQS